jgi:hypothetical protein
VLMFNPGDTGCRLSTKQFIFCGAEMVISYWLQLLPCSEQPLTLVWEAGQAVCVAQGGHGRSVRQIPHLSVSWASHTSRLLHQLLLRGEGTERQWAGTLFWPLRKHSGSTAHEIHDQTLLCSSDSSKVKVKYNCNHTK